MVKRKPDLHSVVDTITYAPPPPPVIVWHVAPLESELLSAHAATLYPDNDYLQIAWIHAVAFLRTESKRGWLLDRKVPA